MSPSIIAMAGLAEAAVFWSLLAITGIMALAIGLSVWAWIAARKIPAFISLGLIAVCIYFIQPFKAFQKAPITYDPDEVCWFGRWRQVSVGLLLFGCISVIALIAAWMKSNAKSREKKA